MGSCAAPSAKGDDKFITTDYLQQCRRRSVTWGFRISEKEVNRKQTAKHTNYKNVCFAVFKDTKNQDRV
ncbi:hypothetical protein EH524_21500 [Salmonella enterica]|nr:hypothetical protein [Salmonella enterica]EBD0735530.1 hypothetical protein [Salmonella enterica]